MTDHPAIQRCTCGHTTADHQSAGTRFPHPPQYGLCLARGCRCRQFRLKPRQNPLTDERQAA